jgi:predicted amidohydrolase YtcJ
LITEQRIPLLKDHHSHPSVYATISGCLDISLITDKFTAISLIKRQKEDIIVVAGWNDSFYTFTKEEIDSLPPLFICNVSFHKFLMNQNAKGKLYNSHKHIVTNIEDQNFVEAKLLPILSL